jgi:hypothetical protein
MRWLLGCLLLFGAAVAVDHAGCAGAPAPGRALLVGRVVDRAGRGLEGAQVELRALPDVGIVRHLATGAGGGFAFGDVVPGIYRVSVLKPGDGGPGAARRIWLRPWQAEAVVVSTSRVGCSRVADFSGCRRREARTRRAPRTS